MITHDTPTDTLLFSVDEAELLHNYLPVFWLLQISRPTRISIFCATPRLMAWTAWHFIIPHTVL